MRRESIFRKVPSSRPSNGSLVPAHKSPFKRVTVIANCHCLPIARTLSLGASGIDADFIDVNFVDQPPYVDRIAGLAKDDGERLIFTFPFGDKWSGISTQRLRDRYGDRCMTFTNVHFTGLHPDITYIGAMGSRVTAVMGDYHSKLILYCYASGINADDCIAMFNDRTYERIGYYGFFEASAAELRARDAECDVQFAEEFLTLVREQPALFTVNHPTDAVLQRLSQRLCAAQNIPFTPFPTDYLTNSLADNFIWPVYDEIAERHNLAYRTPQLFLSARRSQSRGIALREMVGSSYATYALWPADEFRAMVRRLPFFEQFEAVLTNWSPAR